MSFPNMFTQQVGVFFLLAFTKKLKFALPASNKLGSRRSGVVPEGVGRLEFWICRACCFVFCSHPETSSFSVLFTMPWESIMEVISISSCAALFLLLTEMLRSSFKLKYYFTRAAEVTWNHFPAAFWDPGNCVLIARNLEGWSVVAKWDVMNSWGFVLRSSCALQRLSLEAGSITKRKEVEMGCEEELLGSVWGSGSSPVWGDLMRGHLHPAMYLDVSIGVVLLQGCVLNLFLLWFGRSWTSCSTSRPWTHPSTGLWGTWCSTPWSTSSGARRSWAPR